MKKYKQAALSIAMLTFLITGGISSGYIDTKTQDESDVNQAEMVLEAIENDDYDTWKKLVAPKSKITKSVSKEDFEKYIQVRSMVRSGKYDQALELAKDLEDYLAGMIV